MKKYSIIFSVVFTIFVLLPRTSFASSLEIVGQSSNTGTNKTIYYYVDSATYGSLSATVDQFVSDVSRDTGSSYKVFKVVVNNPGDIRATLKEGYEKENLWGAFLIGRISPFTYFGQTDLYGLPMITEHFYEALYFPVNYVSDGLIKQPHVSSNLLPSYHSQIWLGIIYPSKSGIDGTNQIKHYLDRNHSYRLGQLTYQQRMYFSDSIGIG